MTRMLIRLRRGRRERRARRRWGLICLHNTCTTMRNINYQVPVNASQRMSCLHPGLQSTKAENVKDSNSKSESAIHPQHGDIQTPRLKTWSCTAPKDTPTTAAQQIEAARLRHREESPYFEKLPMGKLMNATLWINTSFHLNQEVCL